jgi:hypothetical protein
MARYSFVPDTDDYNKIRVTVENGCQGCDFRHMDNVRCSAIPCNPFAARPWPVIYQKKNAPLLDTL